VAAPLGVAGLQRGENEENIEMKSLTSERHGCNPQEPAARRVAAILTGSFVVRRLQIAVGYAHSSRLAPGSKSSRNATHATFSAAC